MMERISLNLKTVLVDFKPLKILFKLAILVIILVTQKLQAEPWINTQDAFLRADIEMLSDIGIISTPITTYPLMWSGIMKDLDLTKPEDIPDIYKAVFWRVKKAGSTALSMELRTKELILSATNGEQVLRSFGDNARDNQLTARYLGVSKHFAWNIGVTRVSAPFDGDKTHYDGSYLAAVLGNWVVSAGAIEQWWGPSWNSNNLLSNNARPPMGVHIQRNYSKASELPVLRWLGPWDFKLYAAKLDDPRSIRSIVQSTASFESAEINSAEDVKLTGLSFTIKPHRTLELSLRASALWGGEGRTESASSLFDNFFAQQSCELVSDANCTDNYSDSGDRIGGVDLRWTLPIGYPISLYASAYGEDETKFLPSEKVTQFGITSSFGWFDTHWKWFVESTDTILDKDDFNQTYDGVIYPEGYRYYGRAIGSTYDNDSEALSFGVLSRLSKKHQVRLSYSAIELNTDSQGLHGLSPNALQDFKQLKLLWQYISSSLGQFDIELDYTDELYDRFDRIEDKFRVSLSWTQHLN